MQLCLRLGIHLNLTSQLLFFYFFRTVPFLKRGTGTHWRTTATRTTRVPTSHLKCRPTHQTRKWCQTQTVSPRVGNAGDTLYLNTNTFQGPKSSSDNTVAKAGLTNKLTLLCLNRRTHCFPFITTVISVIYAQIVNLPNRFGMILLYGSRALVFLKYNNI